MNERPYNILAQVGVKVKARSKKETIASVKKKLWTIFSEYIRKRDNGLCFTCGKKEEWKRSQAGHYVRRSAGNSLYFDEKNVNAQCFACNIWKGGNCDEYALRLQRKYGKNILNELNKKKQEIKKYTIPELKDLIEVYKNKLLELKI